MNIENVQPNTPAWLELRKDYDTASEAPAALGVSKYTSRTDLLNQKRTGLTPDVDQAKQRLFDRGHESEAMARPLAETILETDLYPVTATLEINGLKLLASLDGATMDETIIFEHKLWSEPLAADVRNGTLSAHYTVQMDQQLLVSGASKCLFMVSDGTKDKMVWTWYEADQAKFAELIAGWQQFHADLANHAPKPVEIKPVGKTPESLPALRIEVTGMVTASNLAEYKEHAMAVFSSINRDLKTDTDFADAEKVVKWCGDVESRLEAVKEHALSQTASIDALFKAIDDIKAEARRTRLDLDKLVTRRKDEIRTEIVTNGRAAYGLHVASLNKEIAPASINLAVPDFAGAIKGKRSLDSMRDAVDVALANGKIAADAQAKAIRANLAVYKVSADGYEFLFADLATLVHKAADDFNLVVKTRIDSRKVLDAKAKEQAEFEALEKSETERLAKLNSTLIVEAPIAVPVAAPVIAEPTGPRMVLTPVRAVPAAAPTSAPTLKLGDISQRLGFNLTADFLKSLGFEPAAVAGASKLYHQSHFPNICNALAAHVLKVADASEKVAA